MLVLTRKADQSIEIDGRITVHVVRLKGNCVRLGIQAPEDVLIVRSELNEWTPPDDVLGSAASGCFSEQLDSVATDRIAQALA